MTLRLTLAEAAKLGLAVEGLPAPSRKAKRSATGADSPQARLQDLLTQRWPKEAVAELTNVVPGRRFRLDVGFPAHKLAVECDGWEWHGKHKGDFQRDRERDRLMTLQGWRILRFPASQIRKDPWGVLEQVNLALGGPA